MAYRKCKKCGRRFESKGTGDCFCSELCRITGFFIGGGGDTSKPGVAQPAEVIPKQMPVRVKKDDERFSRVRLMFEKPPSERWEIAKDFTEEERAYARRLAKRQMMEEARFTREWTWDGGADEEDDADYEGGGTLGESDDGSI